MSANTTATTPRTAVIGAGVVPLIAIAFFFNYADRGNLATAAPLIKDQLGLSSTQIGLLVSAFFWSYVPAQVPAGWFAERFNPYVTMGVGLALWSAATALSSLATGFVTLFALRIMLGLGESVAYPCSAKLFAQHLPSSALGRANGMVGVGMALGPAFGTFFGGLLMAKFGWRSVFLLLGLVSLAWLVPWYLSTHDAAAHANRQPKPVGVPFAAILRRREVWGASLGQFCGNYAFYFVISWLPLYLVKARGLSVPQMAKIGGLMYIAYAISSYTIGRLSDRWIRAGGGTNRVRKTTVIASHALMAACLALAAVGSLRVSVVSLIFAGAAFGFFTPALYAIGQTLAGPRVAAKWMGIQNSVANLAGIVGPIITGVVVDRTGQYYWAFIIAAGLATAGIFAWGLLIRRVEPIDWFAVDELRPPAVGRIRTETPG